MQSESKQPLVTASHWRDDDWAGRRRGCDVSASVSSQKKTPFPETQGEIFTVRAQLHYNRLENEKCLSENWFERQFRKLKTVSNGYFHNSFKVNRNQCVLGKLVIILCRLQQLQFYQGCNDLIDYTTSCH